MLTCDGPLSNFAFNFNLRPYIVAFALRKEILECLRTCAFQFVSGASKKSDSG
jgi:hypothetical protein